MFVGSNVDTSLRPYSERRPGLNEAGSSRAASGLIDSPSTEEGLDLWERRFEMLKQWKRENGTCVVPKAAGLLGRWTSRQRELAKKGRLSRERCEALESVGFVWDANHSAWESRFEALVEFCKTYGHACVPSAHPGLGIWVAKLRGKYRNGKLSGERITRLNSLNFVWSPAQAEWMDKYQALVQFQQRYGHCSVPFKDGEMEKLGWWCNTQRQNRRKAKLSQDRIALLDKIGFVWRPHDVPHSSSVLATNLSPTLCGKRAYPEQISEVSSADSIATATIPAKRPRRDPVDNLSRLSRPDCASEFSVRNYAPYSALSHRSGFCTFCEGAGCVGSSLSGCGRILKDLCRIRKRRPLPMRTDRHPIPPIHTLGKILEQRTGLSSLVDSRPR